jgi:hypothetical protein
MLPGGGPILPGGGPMLPGGGPILPGGGPMFPGGGPTLPGGGPMLPFGGLPVFPEGGIPILPLKLLVPPLETLIFAETLATPEPPFDCPKIGEANKRNAVAVKEPKPNEE